MATDNKKNRFYFNKDFLGSPQGRSIRILSEYYGPLQKINNNKIYDTIVFFGSARIKNKIEAEKILKELDNSASEKQKNRAKKDLEMSKYYEDARNLSNKLTKWSKNLKSKKSRYIITSGGGGGIMEAANRGAKEAGGISMGLTISLPLKLPAMNIYQGIRLKIPLFFYEKILVYLPCKSLGRMARGFGTLDEVMELLTLIQTKKIKKRLPIVLYGTEFWNSVVNWDYLLIAEQYLRKISTFLSLQIVLMSPMIT